MDENGIEWLKFLDLFHKKDLQSENPTLLKKTRSSQKPKLQQLLDIIETSSSKAISSSPFLETILRIGKGNVLSLVRKVLENPEFGKNDRVEEAQYREIIEIHYHQVQLCFQIYNLVCNISNMCSERVQKESGNETELLIWIVQFCFDLTYNNNGSAII